MHILKKLLIALSVASMLSGCASGPRITSIDSNEAFKYERQYLKEFEVYKKSLVDTSKVEWIQPSNKTQPCKIFTSTSENSNVTQNEKFTLFWDGGCKNGYADGLGREFVSIDPIKLEDIAIYSGKKEEPKYYTHENKFTGTTIEGDINNDLYVETAIKEENFSFDINYKIGFFGSKTNPVQLITTTSPFQDRVIYWKNYPDFRYVLIDDTSNEFTSHKYTFKMLNKSGEQHGFAFETPKNGNTRAGEFLNGKTLRLVSLPKNYFSNASSIFSSIKEVRRKAINAQKQALAVKKQYTSRICKESVKVDFMDNDEYKEICNEGERYAELLQKYNRKLEQINQAKAQKRTEIHQRQMINAQKQQVYAAEQQAKAAKQQAYAAQRSANAAQQSNSMQMWQSIMNNTLTSTNQSWSNQSSSNNLQYCYVVSGIEYCN